MQKTTNYLALDVGSRRIGVAVADDVVRISRPLPTVEAGAHDIEDIVTIATDEACDTIIIGYHRSQSGDPTSQTHEVEAFADRLRTKFEGRIAFQDESLTSVLAEERLIARKKPYTKADIDAEAACIILTDFLEK